MARLRGGSILLRNIEINRHCDEMDKLATTTHPRDRGKTPGHRSPPSQHPASRQVPFPPTRVPQNSQFTVGCWLTISTCDKVSNPCLDLATRQRIGAGVGSGAFGLLLLGFFA
ncbi:hypothetical protein BKA56DRAFT_594800 [Ilyonectria sp. MPI-CAGE-AT-0026]|nr:hypothetical protein BKA56DRAFT_594800 [Ilyonectria sp. MPI-CAGE-AT-0026]